MKKNNSTKTKQQSYLPSTFVVLFSKNNIYALYHTINKNLIFFNRDIYNNVKTLFRKNALPLILPGSENKKKPYLKLLIKKDFLVKDPAHERKLVFSSLEKEARSIHQISTFYLFLTLNCNFKCKYCFIKNNETSPASSLMNKSTLKRGIDFFINNCRKRGEKQIVFYGGEPLLAYPLLKWAITYIRKKERQKVFGKGQIIICINTNGSLLTKDILSFFKSHECTVSISLDGKEKINDQGRRTFRGEGTFSQIAAAIDRTRALKIPYAISFTIGKHNIRNLTGNILYLLKRFERPLFVFNFMSDFYERENPFSIPPKILLRELRKVYNLIILESLHENMLHRRWPVFLEPYTNYINCNGYGRQIVLLPDGSVGPCQAFSGTSKYFTKLTPDLDIKSNKIWEEWSTRIVINNKECQKCKYIALCGGGCAYKAFTSSRNINAIDKLNCLLTKLFVEDYILTAHSIYRHNSPEIKSKICEKKQVVNK